MIRIGKFIDQISDGVIGLFDDKALKQIFKQVVNVLLSEICLNALLVCELLFLVHDLLFDFRCEFITLVISYIILFEYCNFQE